MTEGRAVRLLHQEHIEYIAPLHDVGHLAALQRAENLRRRIGDIRRAERQRAAVRLDAERRGKLQIGRVLVLRRAQLLRRRFKLAALFGERRLIQTARADIERLGGTVAVVRGIGNERLVRGALRAVLIAEELGKVRVVIGGLVDGVERLLTDPQQAQLVLIGLFAP